MTTLHQNKLYSWAAFDTRLIKPGSQMKFLIGISERKNEIATFSAMGYFNHEISKSFLRENMLTTVLGTLLGLPFGYYLLISMMKAFEQDSFSITASLSPYSLAYTMILAIIFVLVAQFIVDKNIRQIDKVESLSSRE